MEYLLAIDLGLRTGIALYGEDGRLCWYRSRNFGTLSRLKRGVSTLLNEIPELCCIVLEGGGTIAEIWQKEAKRRGIQVIRIDAEQWREKLLYQREQRSGSIAKRNADILARRVIEWSGATRPTSLRHDAAEAILIGLWAVLERGWLTKLPQHIRK